VFGSGLGEPAGGPAGAATLPSACDGCDARPTAVLCGAGARAVAAFVRVQHQHRYLAKQTLYHEGTPALGLYVVCQGRIKVGRRTGGGRELILRLVDPGGVLGEEALIEGNGYVGTARALEDSRVAFVSREDLLQLLAAHGELAMRLLGHVCQVLVFTQINLTSLALADARSRMAGLLLDLGRRYGQPTTEGTALSLSLSRGELAAMVGLTPETAMRLLSEFRDEGIVRTDRRQAILVRPERLAALAEGFQEGSVPWNERPPPKPRTAS
jgi:CRP/FNR family transcriptional regulator